MGDVKEIFMNSIKEIQEELELKYINFLTEAVAPEAAMSCSKEVIIHKGDLKLLDICPLNYQSWLENSGFGLVDGGTYITISWS
jgi:hypothetical protein